MIAPIHLNMFIYKPFGFFGIKLFNLLFYLLFNDWISF